MVSNPRIDVIMSVYNGETYLREAIESILNQTYTNFRFIIVDDRSNDGSFDIINSFTDERIVVIKNKKRAGLTRNLNKALRASDAEYVARQDADDASLSNRFKTQIDFFEKHPEVDLLGTGVYLINEKGDLIGERFAHPKPSKQIFLKANELFHGSAMIRREAIEAVGGYNEVFKYSQDYELWLRLAKKDNARNIQKPLYALRRHKSSVSLNKTKEQLLFELAARKIAKNELILDEEMKKAIGLVGINHVVASLTTKEKLRIFRTTIKKKVTGRLVQTKTGRALLEFYHMV